MTEVTIPENKIIIISDDDESTFENSDNYIDGYYHTNIEKEKHLIDKRDSISNTSSENNHSFSYNEQNTSSEELSPTPKLIKGSQEPHKKTETDDDSSSFSFTDEKNEMSSQGSALENKMKTEIVSNVHSQSGDYIINKIKEENNKVNIIHNSAIVLGTDNQSFMDSNQSLNQQNEISIEMEIVGFKSNNSTDNSKSNGQIINIKNNNKNNNEDVDNTIVDNNNKNNNEDDDNSKVNNNNKNNNEDDDNSKVDNNNKNNNEDDDNRKVNNNNKNNNEDDDNSKVDNNNKNNNEDDDNSIVDNNNKNNNEDDDNSK
ncbi:hypothetical protein PIROE2DRAFT_4967, partial [Piromyces sp. E2]